MHCGWHLSSGSTAGSSATTTPAYTNECRNMPALSAVVWPEDLSHKAGTRVPAHWLPAKSMIDHRHSMPIRPKMSLGTDDNRRIRCKERRGITVVTRMNKPDRTDCLPDSLPGSDQAAVTRTVIPAATAMGRPHECRNYKIRLPTPFTGHTSTTARTKVRLPGGGLKRLRISRFARIRSDSRRCRQILSSLPSIGNFSLRLLGAGRYRPAGVTTRTFFRIPDISTGYPFDIHLATLVFSQTSVPSARFLLCI